jgi:general secretion pathway protein G
MKAIRTLDAGFTFVELLVVTALVGILAMAIMPLAKVTMQRQREIELRRALRELRTAIDRYKAAADQGQIGGSDVKLGSEGYPPELETLVKGVNRVGTTDRKLKFLRRIPRDPMAPVADGDADADPEWGLRCYQDEPDATSWCGQNVYDVYSKSTGKALDGTKYSEW